MWRHNPKNQILVTFFQVTISKNVSRTPSLDSPEQLGRKHLTLTSPSTSAFISTPCTQRTQCTRSGPASAALSILLTLALMTTDILSMTSTKISLFPPWTHTHTRRYGWDLKIKSCHLQTCFDNLCVGDWLVELIEQAAVQHAWLDM